MIASIQGILVTILVLGILIAIHEAGHFLAAKSIKVPVRQFAIGFGPRIFGFTWGETECRLNWIPLGGYCAFVDDERGEDGEPLPDVTEEMLLRNRAIWQRTWVVSAGVIFNFVSAWLILFGSNLGLGVPTGHQTVGIKDVLPNTAASAVGLKAGDKITAVQHEAFKDFMAFRTRLGDFKQKPVVISILRDGKPQDVTVTPDAKGLIGFKPTVGDERRPVTGPVEAVTMATSQQFETTGLLCSALYQLFTSPGTMMDKTGGPVQILAMGDQIYQDDPWKLLTFAVLLSIELAIINLLPLPALDGGHLVLLLLEKLRGRALPRRVEERILVFGFVMIMGLGMLLIVKDILTVPGMYHQTPVAAPSSK